MTTIEALEKWLKKKGNTPVKIAEKLGLRSSVTVTQWITRGAVPENREKQIKEIIKC